MPKGILILTFMVTKYDKLHDSLSLVWEIFADVETSKPW